MKRKELQIPKNAAAQPDLAAKPETIPAQKKEAVPAKKAERAPAKKRKASPAAEAASEPAGKAKSSPAKKAADTKKKFQKRKKQYQHMMTLIRLVIRIVNAAGRSTMYRK